MKILDPDLLWQFRCKRRCEYCGKAGAVDPHHVFCKGMGGGGQLDVAINLIALCRVCHIRFHAGNISRAAFLKIIAQREGRTADEIEDEIHRLKRMPKMMCPVCDAGVASELSLAMHMIDSHRALFATDVAFSNTVAACWCGVPVARQIELQNRLRFPKLPTWKEISHFLAERLLEHCEDELLAHYYDHALGVQREC